MTPVLPDISKHYRFLYNWSLWIIAILFPLSGYWLKWLYPDFWDPMVPRWAVSGLFFSGALFFVRYPRYRRRYFFEAYYYLFGVLTLWLIVLSYKNSSTPIYWVQALGLLGAAGLIVFHFKAYRIYALTMGAALLALPWLLGESYSPWLPSVWGITLLGFNTLLVQYRAQSMVRMRAMAQLSELGPVPILELTPDGEITFANHPFSQLMGYTREEILGASVAALFPEGALPPADWLSGKHRTYELPLKKKNGEPIIALVNLSPYGMKKANMQAIIVAITDISALKEVEKQLKERNEQMDLFLYKATHDLKGPLASVKGILNIALQSCQQEEIKDYLRMAMTSTDRLDQALVDLLHVTRLNKADLNVEPVDCHELLEEILFSLQHMPESEKVVLTHQVAHPASFYSDKNTLTTILQNLIVNALKYKRSGDHVHKVSIDIQPWGDGVEMVVADNGEGIKPEIQDKVFVMFYRGNKKSKGTGLGLYIVKQGVEKLNGTLEMESVYGQGTTFMLRIPSGKNSAEA